MANNFTINELTSILETQGINVPATRKKKEFYVDLYNSHFKDHDTISSSSTTTPVMRKISHIPVTAARASTRLSKSASNDDMSSENDAPPIKLPQLLPQQNRMPSKSSLASQSGNRSINKMDEITNTIKDDNNLVSNNEESDDLNSKTFNKIITGSVASNISTPPVSSHRIIRKSSLPTPTPHSNRTMVAPAAEATSYSQIATISKNQKAPVLDRLTTSQILAIESAVKNASPNLLLGLKKLNNYDEHVDNKIMENSHEINKINQETIRSDYEMSAAPNGGSSIVLKALYHMLFAVLLVSGIIIMVHWFYTVGFDLKYCPRQAALLNERNPLTKLLPTCIPCGSGAICHSKAVISCYNKGDILEPSVLAEYFPSISWPFPLGRPSCIGFKDVVWTEKGSPSKVARLRYEFETRLGKYQKQVYRVIIDNMQ